MFIFDFSGDYEFLKVLELLVVSKFYLKTWLKPFVICFFIYVGVK